AGRVAGWAKIDRPARGGGDQDNAAAAGGSNARGRRRAESHAVGGDGDGVAAAVADGGGAGQETLGAAGGKANRRRAGADILVHRQVAGRVHRDRATVGGGAVQAVRRSDSQVVGIREGEALAGARHVGSEGAGGHIVGLRHRHGIDGTNGEVGDRDR